MPRTFPPVTVYLPSGSGQALLSHEARYVTIYRPDGVTVESNLQVLVGASYVPATDGRVIVDSSSRTPRLKLNDNVFVQPLIAKPDGSTVTTPIQADTEEVLALVSGAVIVVAHGAVAGTARPLVTQVEWVGSVAPTNAVLNDLWNDSSVQPGVLRRYDGTKFTVVVPSPAPQNALPMDAITRDPGAQRQPGLHRRIGPAGVGAVPDFQIEAPLHLGSRKNIWRYTEDLTNGSYSKSSLTAEAETILVDGITLRRITASGFYAALSSNIVGLGLTPFTPGSRYMCSYYILGVDGGAGRERFFTAGRYLASSNENAFGAKLLTNRLRRVWFIGQAYDSTHLDTGTDATVAYGSGTSAGGGGGTSQVWWFHKGQDSTDGTGVAEAYVGGFQIEEIPNTTIDGIAMIGDSTLAGGSGFVSGTGASGVTGRDLGTSREIARYLEGILNVQVYNRAVGGERLDNMDARWATDMTPLKLRAKYAIIQGGVNDFGQGRTLAQAQTSTSSMVAKAITDGMIPVLFTCGPSLTVGSDATKEGYRQGYNTWLKATYPRVIDIASVLEDPYDARFLRHDLAWDNADGTHYNEKAKRAVAAYAAAWPGWDFRQPAPYQAIPVTTYTNPAALFRDGVQVVGAREAGWTAGTGTPNKGAFAADTATAVQAAQRVLALEQALRTHGLIS